MANNPVALGAKGINGAVTAHGRTSKDENTGGGTRRIWQRYQPSTNYFLLIW
jgi:hypothetical protein